MDPRQMVTQLHADDDALGEAALKCTAWQRRFAEAFVENGGNGAAAAREAGSESEKPAAIASVALRKPHVVAYIAELVKFVNRALAPKAAKVLEEILDDPAHKDRARVALTLVERVDPTETRHNVQVTHVVDHDKDAVEALRHMKAIGATREMLEAHFGFSGLDRYEQMLALEDATKRARSLADEKAITIDAEFTVETPGEKG